MDKTFAQIIKDVQDCTQSLPFTYVSNGFASFKYKNWKGEVSIRHISFPATFQVENTEWHGKTLTMTVFDTDKHDLRHFAVKDIIEIYDEEGV